LPGKPSIVNAKYRRSSSFSVFADAVGCSLTPSMAKGTFLSNLKFKNSVKMHPSRLKPELQPARLLFNFYSVTLPQ
jgi:hypothetical protein